MSDTVWIDDHIYVVDEEVREYIDNLEKELEIWRTYDNQQEAKRRIMELKGDKRKKLQGHILVLTTLFKECNLDNGEDFLPLGKSDTYCLRNTLKSLLEIIEKDEE